MAWRDGLNGGTIMIDSKKMGNKENMVSLFGKNRRNSA